MAGQGITVSIQAKIEGWQDQIKQIQNAMKNIKPGTDISKGLVKDLQQVNDMVNNLGKNMNQRLTSDSQITGFVDKIMQVEEVFGRLGTSMSRISFGDINPEYITAGFRDLLSTLEQANNALGQGMESSFQNAIANSKTLQKEFERMKIDPKTMNIDAVREALAERGKSLEKDVNDGLKKLTDFEKGLEKLKNARDELTARDKFLGKDANATAQSLLIGHQLPTKGTILDADELDKQISFFRSNLLKAGFTPTQLGRIIPDLESVMKAGHWDEMPSRFAEYLREAQNRTRNSLEKASQDYGAAVLQHQKMAGAQSHLSALRFNNTQAQSEVGRILSETVPNDTKALRDVVNNLKQQLEQAVTSGFKGLGSKLFSSSQQGMQDASAAMKDYSAALDQVKAKEQAVSKVQGVVQRYFSIYAAVRMVSKGIRSMMNNIKELDKTITEIAIVTKMDQNDLWGQMPQYTKLAKNYAASISGVYKVSQLYYQQGLGQQDVMALTEQTLKMARISGLDYAEATDYMTNAVRSFKMEMTDAATVVDVYSAVAASSASSVTELATAMSKTASSAAAVGSSFENTTAMLAVMIEATRESPENIGSAMKSIISRYGELKENKTGIDEEGEAYSLNKVDKALQTVGISIHDANGEFRDFDDVIFELSEKWNTIDKNTQRYIATVMAGNRQQSRFLALVSSTERLKEESEKAANSEDASQLQFLKTMDSIEAKTQQFQTSLQSLYTSSGLEKLYKGLLDFGNEFATTLENISSKQGLVGAIGNVGASFTNMAALATTGFGMIKSRMTSTRMSMESLAKKDAIQSRIDANKQSIEALDKKAPLAPSTFGTPLTPEQQQRYNEWKNKRDALTSENDKLNQDLNEQDTYQSSLQARQAKMTKLQGWGMAASAAGMALSAWANTIDINENRGLKSGLTMGSSALQGLGTGLMVGASAGGPIGALVGVLTALPGILSGAGMLTETMAERIQHLEKDITDTKNEKLKSKDELKTLEDYKKKYDELSKSQYESAEKKKEFMELSNSIAASYPELIKSMDAEGNYILNMAEGYERLAEAKRSAYQENLVNSIAAETAGLKDADYVLKNVYGQTPLQNQRAWHGLFDTSSIESLMDMDYKVFTEEKKNQVANLLTNRETANQVFSNLKDENGNLVDFYSFGPNLAANLSTVYNAFIDKINEGKDYSTAVDEIETQLGDSYKYLIDAFGTDVFKELKTRKDLPEYQEKLVDNATNAYNTELVNLLADQTEETFDITSNDIQKRFAKEQISKDFTEWKRGLDTETLTNPEKWQKAVKDFYSKYDAVWYKIEYESDLISSLSNDVNDFYQDMGKHTKADIRKLFPEGELSDLQQQQLEWLGNIFDLDFGDAFETYNKWLQEKDVAKFNVKDYSDKVGADYITQIQSQYKNIISNTGLSEKQITDQVAALNDITDFITNQNLDFDTRDTLLTKYSAADFTSLSGIYNFVDTLSNLDIDLDLTSLMTKVQSLGDVLAVNFEAEIDSYYDAIESSVEDFNKAAKAVTDGTDLKTAREIADKMGKSLSDFQVIDGKFYFDDIEALKEAYIKENDEYIADVQKNVNERYSTLKDLSEVKFTSNGKEETIQIDGQKILEGAESLENLNNLFKSSEAQLGFLETTGITYKEFAKYYEEFLKSDSGDFLTFMYDRVQNTLDESGTAILDYLQQNTARAQIKSGDIKGFLKTTGLVQSDAEIAKEAATRAAKIQTQVNEDISSQAAARARSKQQSNQAINNKLLAEETPEKYYDQIIEEENLLVLEDVQAQAAQLAEQAKELNASLLEQADQLFPTDLDNTAKAIEELQSEGWMTSEDADKYMAEQVELFNKNKEDMLNDFIYSNEYQSEDLEYYKTKEALKLDNDRFALTSEQWDQKVVEWTHGMYESLADIPTPELDKIEADMHKAGYTTYDESTILSNAKKSLEAAKEFNQKRIDAITGQEFDYNKVYSGLKIIDQDKLQEKEQEVAEKQLQEREKWLSEQGYDIAAESNTYWHKKIVDEGKEQGKRIYSRGWIENQASIRAATRYNELSKTTDYETLYQEEYTKLRSELSSQLVEQAMLEEFPELDTFLQDLSSTEVKDYTEQQKEVLERIRDYQTADFVGQIMHGDYSALTGANKQYIGDLYEYASGAAKDVMSNIETALKGGENKIKVTSGNLAFLQELQGDLGFVKSGTLTIGNLAEFDVEQMKKTSDETFTKYINSLEADELTKREWIQSFLDVKYPNKVEQVTSLAGKEKTISRSDFQTYLDAFNKKNKDFESYAKDYGLAFNQYTNSWDINDYDKYIQALKNDAQLLGEGTEARRDAEIAIDAADRQRKNKEAQEQTKAFEDVIKNYDHVTDDQMTALQTALKDDWYLVEQMLTPTGTGEYQLDIAKLRNNLDQLNISDKVKESILEMFTSTADDYLKNISSATNLLTKGTTSQSDIQDFKNQAKALGMTISDSAFQYDDILQAWTLDPAVLRSFVQAQGQQLINAGMLSLDEVTQYVNDNVTKTLVSAIDIKSFLDAEDKSGQARKKFAKQLSNAGIDSRGISGIIDTLISGGGAAVSIIQAIAEIKGEEVTSADIEQAYRAQVSEIENSLDQITFGPGGLVSGYAVTILDTLAKEGKANIVHLDANNAVIQSITDIGAAYAEYYNALANSGEATLEALNEAKAKVLETQDGRYQEQAAIDALGDAAGMTYTTFGAILSTAGIEMTDDIVNQYTESLGGGKMRIKDFASFARVMKWDYDSEEYTSAFKSYNDSLIERNKQVEISINDELKGLENIKPGDWLNLTQTEKVFKKYSKNSKAYLKRAEAEGKRGLDTQEAAIEYALNDTFFKELQDSLVQFGAYFDDGILKISENADILGIAQKLSSSIADAGVEINAELADMIQNIMQSFADSITKGIEGGMTNVEREDLIKKAYSLGFEEEDLDFTETAEGLQLAQHSAIELYKAFAQVDRIKAKKVFESLSKTLEENNEKYSDTTKLLTHIADLEKDINDYSGDTNDARLKQLEAELAVAKQINAERLISGDADWNFMNKNALPGSFTNAIEYWQGWAGASKTLNDAAQKQQIDPQSLATMFQHVYEIAEATGESMTFMGMSTDKMSFSQLLDSLGSIVEIDAKTGEAILSAQRLRELGIELGLGAQGISDGLKKGAEAYAQMNSEQLGKIHEFYDNLATVKKGLKDEKIDWNEFFDSATGTFDYNTFKSKLSNNKKALKAFDDFAKNVSIGEKNLSDILNGSGKLDATSSKTVSSIFKMMMSEDWDPTTGYQTIAEHLQTTGFEGELNLGDMQYQVRNGHVLSKAGKDTEWRDTEGNTYKDAQSAFEEMNEKDLAEYAKEFAQYSQDTDTSKTEMKIPGTEYTVKVEGDHFVLVNTETGKSTEGQYSSAEEALNASREQRIKDINKEISEPKITRRDKTKLLEERKALTAMSDEGYSTYIKSGLSTGGWKGGAKGGKNSYGSIKEEVRSKLTKNNWDANDLAGMANDLAKQFGEFNEYAAAEFKVKTGIDLDPDQVKKDFEATDFQSYIDSLDLTQMASDVADGIGAAFSNEKTSASISSSIQTGVTDALSTITTGEDGAVDITFKGITENIPPEEAKDETKTVKYNVEFTPPTVEPLESTVTYKAIVENPDSDNTDGNTGPKIRKNTSKGFNSATGNIGLANSKGTLMGELGPELVVSNGRYFVVGQSGPEMVNLADDAIVFNHLQTKSLLEKGSSSTRGRAITNEQKATAYAAGSRNGGRAMLTGGVEYGSELTSAGSIIWGRGFDAVKNAKKPDDKDKALKSFLKELERWYNWLQKIAYLEKEISYQEALRSKYQSDFTRTGKEYYDSQIETLGLLEKQIAIQEDLVKQQEKFLEQRKQELANSPLSLVYTQDETGQLVYQEGMYENFSKLFGTNDQGIPYYTAEEQYEALKAMGMESWMQYDSSGQEIDLKKDGGYATAVQAFSDRMEKERDEYQKNFDAIIDGKTKLLELRNDQNGILKEIEDNQISVEQKVLKAIEDSRERAIEDSKKERDAIEKANQKLIDGLNKQLENERTMRQNQKDADELSTLQRRLAILQRSGGSASEIAALQQEITDKQYDKYFATQEQQIQAIEDASAAELERLDNQISIMEETLEYEKLHGLLWNQVYDVLQGSPEDIAAFIQENDSSYWGLSLSNLEQVIRDDLKEIDKYKAFQEDTGADIKKLVGDVSKYIEDQKKEETSTEGNNEAAGGQGTGGSGENSNETEKTNSPPKNQKKSKYGVTVNGETTYFDTKKEAEEFRDNAIGSYELIARNANANLSKKEQDKAVKEYLAAQDIKLVELSAEEIEEITQNQKVAAEEAKINEAKAAVETAKANQNQALSNFKNTTTDAGMLAAAQAIAAAQTQQANANKQIVSSNETIKKIKKKKASGGYVNHGIYELGELGTETVLTASQTKVLHDNILSNRPDSLINLLKSYNEAYHGLSSTAYDSISNVSDNSVVIERAEVNLQIDELANDYDARRAANTVMDELLQIARKTSASNRVGRR